MTEARATNSHHYAYSAARVLLQAKLFIIGRAGSCDGTGRAFGYSQCRAGHGFGDNDIEIGYGGGAGGGNVGGRSGSGFGCGNGYGLQNGRGVGL